MSRRLVVALCLIVSTLALANPQESDDGEDVNDQGWASWRARSIEDARFLANQAEEVGEAEPFGVPDPGTTVSVSAFSAPKSARKAYQRGLDELKKKNPDLGRVRSELNKAVAEYPEMAPAWETLGWLSVSEGKPEEAERMFLQSVEADGRYQNGYVALAHNALDAGRWQEAIDWSTRALKLDPSASRAHFYLALASFQLNDLDGAAREATSALVSRSPFLPGHAHQILGAVYHRRNDLPAAAAEYRIFLKAEPRHPLAAGLARQVAEWESAGLVASPKGRKRRM